GGAAVSHSRFHAAREPRLSFGQTHNNALSRRGYGCDRRAESRRIDRTLSQSFRSSRATAAARCRLRRRAGVFRTAAVLSGGAVSAELGARPPHRALRRSALRLRADGSGGARRRDDKVVWTRHRVGNNSGLRLAGGLVAARIGG